MFKLSTLLVLKSYLYDVGFSLFGVSERLYRFALEAVWRLSLSSGEAKKREEGRRQPRNSLKNSAESGRKLV